MQPSESRDEGPDRKSRWFPTTHWTVVLTAGGSDSIDGERALERLCRTYWYPLYSYVRRCGHSSHDAQDLTQAFFAHLLKGDAFTRIGPEKGKFRSFLLVSINHFLANARERVNATKRGGGKTLVSLEDEGAEERFGLEPVSNLTPEQYFEKRWASALLEHAVARLREEYEKASKGAVFERLKVFLAEEAAPGDYAAAAGDLGMSTNSVTVAVHRLRHRYRELILDEIAETVETPAEIEEEMRYLLGVLER